MIRCTKHGMVDVTTKGECSWCVEWEAEQGGVDYWQTRHDQCTRDAARQVEDSIRATAMEAGYPADLVARQRQRNERAARHALGTPAHMRFLPGLIDAGCLDVVQWGLDGMCSVRGMTAKVPEEWIRNGRVFELREDLTVALPSKDLAGNGLMPVRRSATDSEARRAEAAVEWAGELEAKAGKPAPQDEVGPTPIGAMAAALKEIMSAPPAWPTDRLMPMGDRKARSDAYVLGRSAFPYSDWARHMACFTYTDLRRLTGSAAQHRIADMLGDGVIVECIFPNIDPRDRGQTCYMAEKP